MNSNLIPSGIAASMSSKFGAYPELVALVQTYSTYTDEKAIIKLVNANMSIIESRTIGQGYFIDAVADSVIEISTFEYFSPSTTSTIITAESSTMTIENCNLSSLRLTSSNSTYLFKVVVSSTMTMKNTTFDLIEVPILN